MHSQNQGSQNEDNAVSLVFVFTSSLEKTSKNYGYLYKTAQNGLKYLAQLSCLGGKQNSDLLQGASFLFYPLRHKAILRTGIASK